MACAWEVSPAGVRLARVKNILVVLFPIVVLRCGIAVRQEGAPLANATIATTVAALIVQSFASWVARTSRPGCSVWSAPNESARRDWEQYHVRYMDTLAFSIQLLQTGMLLTSMDLTAHSGWLWKNVLFFTFTGVLLQGSLHVSNASSPFNLSPMIISVPLNCLASWYRAGMLFKHPLTCALSLVLVYIIYRGITTYGGRLPLLMRPWLARAYAVPATTVDKPVQTENLAPKASTVHLRVTYSDILAMPPMKAEPWLEPVPVQRLDRQTREMLEMMQANALWTGSVGKTCHQVSRHSSRPSQADMHSLMLFREAAFVPSMSMSMS